MNKQRVEQAIDMMRNAKNLDMSDWQIHAAGTKRNVNSIEELHSCGNTACFAGYLAISPEFHAAGGSCGLNGTPVIDNGLAADDAVARYLDISPSLAHAIVYGHRYHDIALYPVAFNDVKPEHVIAVLECVLTGQLV